MELFTKLFGGLLLFVYHCFDRIVINGYLSGLSRPEQVVHFFRVFGGSELDTRLSGVAASDPLCSGLPLPGATEASRRMPPAKSTILASCGITAIPGRT